MCFINTESGGAEALENATLALSQGQGTPFIFEAICTLMKPNKNKPCGVTPEQLVPIVLVGRSLPAPKKKIGI